MHLTKRQAHACAALTRSVQREGAHVRRFGRSPRVPAEVSAPTVRASGQGLVMPLEAFASADYGQLCQYLGLRPSKPHANAAGRDTRKRRGKRS